MSFISSHFPSCFRPSKTTDHRPPPPTGNPNLTTYIYQTDAGTVSLTWSRSILGRTLHLHLHNNHNPIFDPDHSDPSSFDLHIKPFVFWKKKHGSKKLSQTTLLFWNLSKARFGSGPEPHSGFYVALVVDHVLALVVGDMDPRPKFGAHEPKNPQALVLKREHVDVDVDHHHHARNGNGSSSSSSSSSYSYCYATKARLGGKVREIEVEYCDDKNTRLLFRVDGGIVLEVKRLRWKFRGNERVDHVDGVPPVQISWDVHDWVFQNGGGGEGKAVFMFKFEENNEVVVRGGGGGGGGEVVGNVWNLGSCETGKSWSSSSLSMSSSAGSFGGGSSSVMEWSSVEENELVLPLGFSLLVYAWKR